LPAFLVELETTRRLLLWCYWRYALRERGFDLLAVAARDPAADAELIEPLTRALPETCSRFVLGKIGFLE
jgi:hypothetical protein